IVTPKFVHKNDGKTIDVSAKFSDKNGLDDLVDYQIDATGAGGGKYTKANGLATVSSGADYIEVHLATPFPHIRQEGQYEIPAEAHDEKNSGTEKGLLFVGNEVPLITGTGYIFGGDGDPINVASVKTDAPKNLCPNDPFRVGLIMSDAEGDELVATVTI